MKALKRVGRLALRTTQRVVTIELPIARTQHNRLNVTGEYFRKLTQNWFYTCLFDALKSDQQDQPSPDQCSSQ